MNKEDFTSDSCGVSVLNLSVVRVAGSDRAKFLHNFCTADIKKLQPDQCCEAFFLNTKGKTSFHGIVVSREIDLLIVSTTTKVDELINSLDMYLLSDDVQLSNDSSIWRSVFLFGPEWDSVAARSQLQVPADGAALSLGFQVVVKAELAGQGLLILEPAEGDGSALNSLVENGAKTFSPEELHVERVANQTPWCETEITDACLPQELRRDSKAISFTKGCYLGQETVARLDALGHVNRYLAGFAVEEGNISAGDEIRKDDKKIGTVTSVAEDANGKQIGLGFLRVQFTKPNELLECEGLKVTVL